MAYLIINYLRFWKIMIFSWCEKMQSHVRKITYFIQVPVGSNLEACIVESIVEECKITKACHYIKDTPFSAKFEPSSQASGSPHVETNLQQVMVAKVKKVTIPWYRILHLWRDTYDFIPRILYTFHFLTNITHNIHTEFIFVLVCTIWKKIFKRKCDFYVYVCIK